jgi:hypothetical protein
MNPRRIALGFIAGFLAVPLGHQIMLTLLHGIGFTGYAPWDVTPVPPLGVPTLLSQSFWGGVWGIGFALIEPRLPRSPMTYWISVTVFGGVALTAVFIVAVLPFKGAPPNADPPAIGLTMAFLVNGAWGVVTALLLRLFSKRSA